MQGSGADRAADAVAGPREGSGRRWLLSLPLLLALWMASRPYHGLVHDAQFYAVAALARLEPSRFAEDFFFAHGSHDAFTIFSALYAPLVAFLGVPVAHAVGLVVAHVVWLAGLVALMRTAFPRGQEWLVACAAAITLHAGYAYLGMFGYGEAFLTPRLFAEAAVLGAIALALRRRWAASAGLLLVGMGMHPIMTLGGVGVVGLLAWLDRPRLLLVALAGGVAFVGLALAGIDPFTRLFATYDDEWWSTVQSRGAFALLQSWTLRDWMRVAPMFLAATLVIGAAPREERALPAVALLTATAGMIATVLGADLGRSLLVVSGQPWRAIWLLGLVANAWIAVVALRLPKESEARTYLLIALAVAAMERIVSMNPYTSPVVLLIALVAHAVERRTGRPIPRALWWILTPIACAALPLTVVGFWGEFRKGDSGLQATALAVSGAVTAAALAVILLQAWRGALAAWRVLLAGTALVVMAASALDRRSAWTRFIASPEVPAELTRFVADAGETVYWQFGLHLLWFKLHRPSAWSCSQGAGIVYFRGTATEFARRAAALAVLNTDDDFSARSDTDCPPKRYPAEFGPRDAEALAQACRALPELDSIVLLSEVPGAPHTTWRPNLRFTIPGIDGARAVSDAFHLYRCADFR